MFFKKILLAIFFLLTAFFLWSVSLVQAQEEVFLTLFYSKTCPHCAKEKIFLKDLQRKYSFLKVREFKISEELVLFEAVVKKLNKNSTYIPFTVIGEEVVVGYQDDQTTGKKIENIVIRHSKIGCYDVVNDIMFKQGLVKDKKETIDNSCVSDKEKKEALLVKLPLFGNIDANKVSLLLLTVAIAFVDGFNPCAMWVLLFLISLLIGLKDKKKLIILGSTFIFVSGLVYFFFLAAWLNVFLFLGFVSWIRFIIGVIAIISGALHLRDYCLQRTGCKATDKKKRSKVFTQIQKIINARSFWIALLGISVLAVSVNMLELVCSAGLPAIYTQVLALANLATWQYYAYLLLYILVFILDDLVIFLIAVFAWQTIGVSSKFSRYSNLIGGIIIFFLGILLIFKPGWVMFG